MEDNKLDYDKIRHITLENGGVNAGFSDEILESVINYSEITEEEMYEMKLMLICFHLGNYHAIFNEFDNIKLYLQKGKQLTKYMDIPFGDETVTVRYSFYLDGRNSNSYLYKYGFTQKGSDDFIEELSKESQLVFGYHI